ncbi:hypothetical protein SCH4B_3610 [Ruegeria sp. TrichCH4B]|nr:hypothetical protein SCH4B_3610 [Ruegeria sp. TrichCH4B]
MKIRQGLATGGTGDASGDVGDTKKERFCRKWQNYVSPDKMMWDVEHL